MATTGTAPGDGAAAPATQASGAPPAPDPGRLTAAPEHGPAGDRSAASMQSVLEIAGVVVGASTFITALAFYFGWTITASNAAYFGIDSDAFGYSTQDYVLRSTDAVFVPLGAVVLLGLVALSVHAAAMQCIAAPARRPLLRRLTFAGILAGGVLLVLGIWGALRPLPFATGYLFIPASPGFGIALLAYGVHVAGLVRAAEGGGARLPRLPGLAVTLVCLLVVLSAFLTTATFAAAYGRGLARGLGAKVRVLPPVTVFSPQRLHLERDGVTEQRLRGGDSAYRYRYDGLRLLMRADDRYFLLPDGWTRKEGAAIVLTDSSSLRFEFGGR